MQFRSSLKYASLIVIAFVLHIVFVSAYETYVVNVTVKISDNKPVAIPSGGVYNTSVIVNLSSSESGALIYYTLNGENPSCLPIGNLYIEPILIDDDSVLKAVACGQNNSRSGLLTESYVIEIPSASSQPLASAQVIINEVMWMGSDISTADEWIELKNLSTSTVDLNGWLIQGAGTGTSSIILEGIIAAGGYYLITNFQPSNASSSLVNSIVPNKVINLSLSNSGEQLILKDANGAIIDRTPLGAWPAGTNSDELKQSMGRNSLPGDGLLSENWHTCTHESCNDTIYWDTEGNNYGTPGGDNL